MKYFLSLLKYILLDTENKVVVTKRSREQIRGWDQHIQTAAFTIDKQQWYVFFIYL